MALFGREPGRPDRLQSTAAALADPVRHAEWTVRLGADWQLLDNRSAVLAVTNPERAYSVRSADGYLLTQTEVAVIDAEDLTAASAAGLLNGALFALSAAMGVDIDGGAHGARHAPDERAKLRIRDTRSRMIIADCHRTPGGIVVRVLPGGGVNQRFVTRALAPAVAEALTRSGPWLYRLPGSGRGELRNRDGQLLAADTFTRSETSGSSGGRGGLIYWSVRVEENPFPTSWLFALLLACEHLRR